ncbi:hypothetical protein GCM10027418_08800 [Mariniluteicoccus endophyticus]
MPLVRERGFDVSTADVAAAAGIAEGTLFRVFPTKADLLSAVVHQVMDPADDIARLDAIDRTLPLPTRIRLVVDQWTERIDDVSVMMAAIHTSHAGREAAGAHKSHDAESMERHRRQSQELDAAVERVIAPDADALRVPVHTAALFVRSATFAATHPMVNPGDRIRVDDLVTMLVAGITAQETPC